MEHAAAAAHGTCARSGSDASAPAAVSVPGDYDARTAGGHESPDAMSDRQPAVSRPAAVRGGTAVAAHPADAAAFPAQDEASRGTASHDSEPHELRVLPTSMGHVPFPPAPTRAGAGVGGTSPSSLVWMRPPSLLDVVGSHLRLAAMSPASPPLGFLSPLATAASAGGALRRAASRFGAGDGGGAASAVSWSAAVPSPTATHASAGDGEPPRLPSPEALTTATGGDAAQSHVPARPPPLLVSATALLPAVEHASRAEGGGGLTPTAVVSVAQLRELLRPPAAAASVPPRVSIGGGAPRAHSAAATSPALLPAAAPWSTSVGGSGGRLPAAVRDASPVGGADSVQGSRDASPAAGLEGAEAAPRALLAALAAVATATATTTTTTTPQPLLPAPRSASPGLKLGGSLGLGLITVRGFGDVEFRRSLGGGGSGGGGSSSPTLSGGSKSSRGGGGDSNTPSPPQSAPRNDGDATPARGATDTPSPPQSAPRDDGDATPAGTPVPPFDPPPELQLGLTVGIEAEAVADATAGGSSTDDGGGASSGDDTDRGRPSDGDPPAAAAASATTAAAAVLHVSVSAATTTTAAAAPASSSTAQAVAVGGGGGSGGMWDTVARNGAVAGGGSRDVMSRWSPHRGRRSATAGNGVVGSNHSLSIDIPAASAGGGAAARGGAAGRADAPHDVTATAGAVAVAGAAARGGGGDGVRQSPPLRPSPTHRDDLAPSPDASPHSAPGAGPSVASPPFAPPPRLHVPSQSSADLASAAPQPRHEADGSGGDCWSGGGGGGGGDSDGSALDGGAAAAVSVAVWHDVAAPLPPVSPLPSPGGPVTARSVGGRRAYGPSAAATPSGGSGASPGDRSGGRSGRTSAADTGRCPLLSVSGTMRVDDFVVRPTGMTTAVPTPTPLPASPLPAAAASPRPHRPVTGGGVGGASAGATGAAPALPTPPSLTSPPLSPRAWARDSASSSAAAAAASAAAAAGGLPPLRNTTRPASALAASAPSLVPSRPPSAAGAATAADVDFNFNLEGPSPAIATRSRRLARADDASVALAAAPPPADHRGRGGQVAAMDTAQQRAAGGGVRGSGGVAATSRGAEIPWLQAARGDAPRPSAGAVSMPPELRLAAAAAAPGSAPASASPAADVPVSPPPSRLSGRAGPPVAAAGGASHTSASSRTTPRRASPSRAADGRTAGTPSPRVPHPLAAAARGGGGRPPTPPATSASGTSFRDSGVIIDVLGSGASATVYKMVHVPTLSVVAAKVLSVEDSADKRTALANELRALHANFVTFMPAAAATVAAAAVSPPFRGDTAAPDATATPHAGAGAAWGANAGDARATPAPPFRPPSGPCPYLLAFYDAYTEPGESTLTFVTEYMDAGTLDGVIRATPDGVDDDATLSRVAHALLSALAFLHARGIIHRDIKPSNVLLNHWGEVKVADLGAAHDLRAARRTALREAQRGGGSGGAGGGGGDRRQVTPGGPAAVTAATVGSGGGSGGGGGAVAPADSQLTRTFVGTRNFMSLERLEGTEYGVSADVWSAGVTLLTLALGRFPFVTAGGEWGMLNLLRAAPLPLPPRGGRYSDGFLDVLARMLQRDPADRPSAADLLRHPWFGTHAAHIARPADEMAASWTGDTAGGGGDSEAAPPVDATTGSGGGRSPTLVTPAALLDLRKLVAAVTNDRASAAMHRGAPLARIPSGSLRCLAWQLGLPDALVAAEFATAHRRYETGIQRSRLAAAAAHVLAGAPEGVGPSPDAVASRGASASTQ